MCEPAKGIAHLSFRGGGMLLPARSPYDRQLLTEHVVSRVRTDGRVQVLLDDRCWLVHLRRGPGAACCTACGHITESSCISRGCGNSYCVKCAFSDQEVSVRLAQRIERRGAS